MMLSREVEEVLIGAVIVDPSDKRWNNIDNLM